MKRSPRSLRTAAIDTLLRGRVATVARSRDWDLLREVARLAADDATIDLAVTDPFLFGGWRAAVTRFHIAGWTKMTPGRVDEVRRLHEGNDDPASLG